MTLRTLAIYGIYAGAGTLLGAVCFACGGVATRYGSASRSNVNARVSRLSGRQTGVSVPAKKVDIARTQSIYTALSLLWRAESSCGTDLNMDNGDGGLAIGHFQQHEGHWRDGCEALGVNWPLSDRYNLARAAAVAAANWSRYARQALEDGNVEMLIRQLRLPNDPHRPSNDRYVERVMR